MIDQQVDDVDQQVDDVLRGVEQRRRALDDIVEDLIKAGGRHAIRATRKYLRQAVFLSTKEERAVVTTFIALCHVTLHKVIDWMPYLGAHNDAGAGKSTLGDVVASLAGGCISGGHSAPSVYRWLDENRGRLFVADEGEKILRGERKEAFQEILLQGPKLGATISRARPGPKSSGCDHYQVWGPKMVVSIRGADVGTAMARRIITIEMQAPSVAEFSSLQDRTLESVLCNRLKAWAGAHVKEIGTYYTFYKHSPTYGSGYKYKFASQPQRQLWAGMLAVAQVAGLLDPVADYCHAHERATDLRIELSLEDALQGLLDTLKAGRYRYKDLHGHLRKCHGERADRWTEECIGRIFKRVLHHARIVNAGKDSQGRYVVVGGAPAASTQPLDVRTLATTIAETVAAVQQAAG